MRTSESLYHQIRWDPRFDPARFVLGVDAHAAEPKRVRLVDFVPGGDLPWHRILFVEADGEVVWDRRTGLDRLERSTAGRAERRAVLRPPFVARAVSRWDGAAWVAGTDPGDGPPGPLRVVTWNTLFDVYDRALIRSAERRPWLVDLLGAQDADLLALQEVETPLAELLLAAPWVRAAYAVTEVRDVDDHGLLLLSRLPVREAAFHELGPHKGAFAVVVRHGDRDVVAVTTHLLSGHARDGAQRRARQLERLGAALAELEVPVVLLGDLNDPTDAPQQALGARDAWLDTGRAEEPTFDPTVNPLAASCSLDGRPVRIDRVLLRGAWQVESVDRLGTVARPDGLFPSDHFGLAAVLGEPTVADGAPAPTRRTALAWLLPEDRAAAVQALRARHDPAFDRWPPHVNVLWGFCEEHELDRVAPALSAAVASVPPFPVVLEGLSVFHHTRDATVWLDPTAGGDAGFAALRRATAPLVAGASEAFRPHLTVAKSSRGEADAARWRSELGTIRAEVAELCVLTRRGDEPMQVRARVALGTGALTWVDGAPPALEEPAERARRAVDAQERLAAAFPEARLGGSGSRALGIGLGDADLDLVAVFPSEPEDLLARVAAALPGATGLRRVDTARMRGVKLRLGDLPVDLALVGGPGDTAAARGLRDVEATLALLGPRRDVFRRLAREVKAWARGRGLDGAPFGGLPGLAWTVLVGRAVLEAPVDLAFPALRTRFFERWASHDPAEPIVLDPAGTERPGRPGDPLRIGCPGEPDRTCTEAVSGPVLRRLQRALFDAWERCEAGGDSLPDLRRPSEPHREHAAFVVVVVEGPPDRLPEQVGRLRSRLRHLLTALEQAGADDVHGWPRPCVAGPTRVAFAVGLGRSPHDDPALIEAARSWAAEHGPATATLVCNGEVPTLA